MRITVAGRRVGPVLAVCLLLFACSWGAVAQAAPAARGSSAPPSVSYLFAHRYLPQTLYADPQLALSLTDAANGQKALEALWNVCRITYPTAPGASVSLPVASARKVGESTMLLLITMPQPRNVTEAYYIGVLIPCTGTGKAMRATNLAYNTLEKSIDIHDLMGTPPPAARAVPTVLGGWTRDRSHRNFGPGPSPANPEDFVAAMLRLYEKVLKL